MTAREIIINFDKEELYKILNNSYSLAECLRKMGLKGKWDRQYTPILHYKIKKDKINYTLLKINHHPNLDINYFKEINTKQKAYWLGFLAADAYIKRGRLSLQLGEKDKYWLLKFIKDIGANNDVVTEYINKNYKKPSKRIIFELYNKDFINHLINLGFESPKSYNLHLPNFDNQEIMMAFILGYFDGDGTQSSTILTSCSLNFFLQIKNIFKLKNNPIKKSNNIYKFSLGTFFFKQLLLNYSDSLDRKKIYYYFKKNKRKKNKNEHKHKKTREIKLKLSDSTKIENLVKKFPLTAIAKIFNCSDNAIKKFCKRNFITIPKKRRYLKNNLDSYTAGTDS